MDLELSNRTALVLAGGGGLGRAVATRLALEGATVAIADLNAKALETTVAAGMALGCRIMPVTWDISDLSVVDAQVSHIEETLGAIDILINNTGGPPPTSAGGVDPKLWRKSFEEMILSVIAISDRVSPNMRARSWGRIITSVSSGVIVPIPNLAVSNALRLSLVGWSKTLSRELARDGITVNIVVPGRIATDRTRLLDEAKAKREGRTIAEVAAESVATIPMGRYGDPNEYGDAVTYLASARASYITGAMIRVDGGLIQSI
jgi:3-oxoacyl-[acyl-carrier protein] reductase